VLTPFFLGATLGAVASGRVPVGNAAGNQITSWWNATSVTVGLLAVAMGGYLSAIYLVVEARRQDEIDLERYFRVRALAAGVAALLLGGAALTALYFDARTMFDRVTGRSIPLIIIGVLALAASFVMARRGAARGLRVLGALGVAALVWSWAVAQAPYLLPFSLTIAAGAGADVTQRWLLGWALVALVTVVPLLSLLYVLDQRGTLGEDPTTSRNS
jgi:cytochrome d ubiquinol oxidase subunit II